MSDQSTPSTAERCPICKGAGYYLLDVDFGNPEFGKLRPCRCTIERLQQRRLARVRDASNLTGALLEKRFDTFRADRPAQHQALSAARAFAEKPSGWLVLVGANGKGKTHLAAAIANERLAQGQPALFVVVPDLLDHLRATYHPRSQVSYDARFDQVRTHPLLILDDLGAENDTAWANEKLFQIVNHRYNNALPTVVTSNIVFDDWDSRIRARAQDASISRIVRVDGPLQSHGAQSTYLRGRHPSTLSQRR